MKGMESLPMQEASETRAEREYAEAVSRYRELHAVVGETENLIHNERPAETYEEELIARLNLEREGLLGQAEAYAQKGEASAERSMRMLEQLKSAEQQILSLYFDARADSQELADLIEKEHPWVVTYGYEAPEDDEISQAA
jgi:flagellar motor switch protein FliG